MNKRKKQINKIPEGNVIHEDTHMSHLAQVYFPLNLKLGNFHIVYL